MDIIPFFWECNSPLMVGMVLLELGGFSYLVISWVYFMFLPLVQEIAYLNPVRVFARFAGQDGAVFFDSASPANGLGRYSFIAVDPFQVLKSKDGAISCEGEFFFGDPFRILAERLTLYPLLGHEGLPPFQGGVAGYFGYDLRQHVENVTVVQLDGGDFPDMVLGFYDLVLAFDIEGRRAWIFSSGYPLQEESARVTRAVSRCQWLMDEYAQLDMLSPVARGVVRVENISANFTAESYQAAVRRAVEYILAGDIFEVNLAQCFTAVLPENLPAFDLYRRLRLVNPAPFAAFLHFGDWIIASASPERFMRLQDGCVEARPIKGTRPRGSTQTEDLLFADALLLSEKDRAENIMIVDLMRNDLSRVCRDHSVIVTQLCGLESFATVHHLVSVVVGWLQKGLMAVDLLRATFPGGSITGAPKIRAMEIIAEIEPFKRGVYCGSVGYIGFNGDMDCSSVIRTFALKDNIVSFHVGGAVVADSDPSAEYEETLMKAKALRQALSEAREEYDFVN
jgi:para-aminobenzoate synthetase component 1